jgi:hypothetical protein
VGAKHKKHLECPNVLYSPIPVCKTSMQQMYLYVSALQSLEKKLCRGIEVCL